MLSMLNLSIFQKNWTEIPWMWQDMVLKDEIKQDPMSSEKSNNFKTSKNNWIKWLHPEDSNSNSQPGSITVLFTEATLILLTKGSREKWV